MGKRQWAHHTKKKIIRNSDAPKLDNIQMQLEMLNHQIKISDREVRFYNKKFVTKNHVHETDLVLNKVVHLHHDTVKIHGELGYPNAKTLRRDSDYIRANIPFVVLNADLAKQCNLPEADLAEYLYYHELQKIEAKKVIEEEVNLAV